MQHNVYVHKSSSMLTVWLQLKLEEDKTTQYFWSTSNDMYHIQAEKTRHSKMTFTKTIFYHASGSQLFLPTLAVNSRLMTELRQAVTFTSGILAAQQDSLCFQRKHTFYILAHYTDLQLQIFTYHSRMSNMTAPIPQVIFPPPQFMLAIYFGSSF